MLPFSGLCTPWHVMDGISAVVFADAFRCARCSPQTVPSAQPRMLFYPAVNRGSHQTGPQVWGPRSSGIASSVVAEPLHDAPPTCLTVLLEVLKHILRTGDVPHSRRRTCIQMLPKVARAKVPADFRPIVSFRCGLGRSLGRLHRHEVSQHTIWVLHVMYLDQHGLIHDCFYFTLG